MFCNPALLSLSPEIAALSRALPCEVEGKLRVQYEALIQSIMVSQSVSERGNVYRWLVVRDFAGGPIPI